MLKNYLTIAFRNLRRHKGYTAINIIGLAVGLACCILIFWFVRSEIRTDGFHAQADRHLLAHGEQRFYEEQFFYADSTFFDLFTFPLEKGDPDAALDAPGSIVLTQQTAEKYFGKEDPMGKTLTFDDERRFTVTGVLAPLPGRSHLRFDFLLSFSTFQVPRGYPVTLESWHWISFYTYVLLDEGADPAAVEAKLPGFMARHFDEERAQNVRLRLQPVTDIYLGTPKDTFIASGNPAYVYGLSGIAVLVLLLACFNFMNLSTTTSIRRSKEAGVRKALGAHRGSLVKQFLGEAILTALISLLLALLLVQGGSALLSGWIGWEAAVSARAVGLTLALFAGVAVLLGAAAGAYPAFVVSRFEPSRALRGDAPGGLSNAGLRRGLVALQFTIAIALIASLKADWQAVAPDVPFEYSFLDDRIQRLYEEDRRFFRLIVAASLLAILVACLGLYGLVAFATQLRTKEIGIRKVLGASVPNLVALLTRPFLLYVLGANLLAWPLAYLAMHRWLEGFAYRIEVSLVPFLVAGLLTLVVAFLTMSRQSIKAALADPVESLRYE